MNDMISNDIKIKILTFFPVKNIFNQNNDKIKINCIKNFYDEKNSEHFKISIIKMMIFYIFWFNIK